MKTLFLLRHAKALAEDPALPDARRPLTEEGFHDAKKVSEALRELNLIPEVIISSDAVRALTTAFIFIATFEKISGDVELNPALYDSTVTDYNRVISEIDDRFSSCMIVGHNNTISMLAIELLKKNMNGLKPCGVLVLTSNVNHWSEFSTQPCSLRFETTPDEL